MSALRWLSRLIGEPDAEIASGRAARVGAEVYGGMYTAGLATAGAMG
jgi:hypothetical protein